ncbi:MAG: HPF/RaiA family ribosome-associated protein [Candidatus Diapherotrites archaeon]
MERKITIIHLPAHNEVEKAQILQTLEKTYDKLANYSKEAELQVYFKEYHTQGKRQEIEVRMHLISKGKKINAVSKDWVWQKALKKAVQALKKEAKKYLSKK